MAKPSKDEKKKPEKHDGSMLPVTAAVLGPAIATYLIARRPFGFSRAQKAIQQKGMLRILPGSEHPNVPGTPGLWGRLKRYLLYGTPDVVVKGERAKQIVSKKPVWNYGPYVKAKTPAHVGNKGVIPPENKDIEYNVLSKYAPEATGKHVLIKKMLKKLPPTVTSDREKILALEAALRKRMPKGYIIKATGGAASQGTNLTDKQNLLKLYDQLAKKPTFKLHSELMPDKDIRGVLKTHKVDPAKIGFKDIQRLEDAGVANWETAENIIEAARANRKRDIWRMLNRPGEMIAQEKFKIQKLPYHKDINDWYHKRTGSWLPIDESNEWRVHAVGGKAIPTGGRHGQLMDYFTTPFGFQSSQGKEVTDYAQKILNRLPSKYRKGMYGFDIAMTDAGPRVIETNPGGYSGFIRSTDAGTFNPVSMIQSHLMASQLAGQNTRFLSGLRGAAVGALGGTAYGLGKSVAGDRSLEPEVA